MSIFKALVGCPTVFCNSALPSHCPSATFRESDQPHSPDSHEGSLLWRPVSRALPGRVDSILLDLGGASEVFWSNTSSERWGSETRDTGRDLLNATRELVASQECTLWDSFSINSFPHSSCYTQEWKKVPNFLEVQDPFVRDWSTQKSQRTLSGSMEDASQDSCHVQEWRARRQRIDVEWAPGTFQVLWGFRMKAEVFLLKLSWQDSPSLGRKAHFPLLFISIKMVISKDHLWGGEEALLEEGLWGAREWVIPANLKGPGMGGAKDLKPERSGPP